MKRLLLCNLWVMTSPTSTGNHNSHQIVIEEVSRNSSAPSEMEWSIGFALNGNWQLGLQIYLQLPNC
ncbi:hypothetical protein Q3G72_021775 [Acer saccharum]|nr:hypothetical protein Q3G72_021775 [Acer saccharum]